MNSEQSYLNYIFEKTEHHRRSNILGIGDDAAIIPMNAAQSLCITQDLSVDKIHFDTKIMTAKQIARRSLTSVVSDLSAMGAKPLYGSLSLGLTRHQNFNWFRDFIDETVMIFDQLEMLLIGGDLTRCPSDCVVDFNLIGTTLNPLKQNGTMQTGDYIGVTGKLGGAKLAIESGVLNNSYLNPPIRIQLMQDLAAHLSGATDISDGLTAELSRVAASSHLGVLLYKDKIPLLDSVKASALADPVLFSIDGSDDYEVVFWTKNLSLFAREDVYLIGQAVPIGSGQKPGQILLQDASGSYRELETKTGWDPFSE